VECFDIDLPKGETRSDWLQRPLQEKQLHYAAQDVAYLPTIYMKQLKLLEEKGRLAWFQQECESLLNTYRKEMKADFYQYYLNIRGAWQLNSPQLHILRELAQWRELHARKRDKPRNWIIKDKSLIDIARLMPASIEQLGTIDELAHNFLRHEGQDILDLVANALAEPDESRPVTLPQPLDGKAKSRLKKGQQYAEKKSIELDLPVEILIRKRWLITILQDLHLLDKCTTGSPEDLMLPEELAGWRKDLLFPGLIESMR
jgi:ribonuclease D